MSTIITKGNVQCRIETYPDRLSDGNEYRVLETGYKSTSEKLAINHAFRYIEKKTKRHGKVKAERRVCVQRKPTCIERTKPKLTLDEMMAEFNAKNLEIKMVKIDGEYKSFKRRKKDDTKD